MKKIKYFLLVILLLVCSIRSVFAESPTLKALLQDEIENPERAFPEELRNILTQKHFVFVDGMMNELASIVGNYYSDNFAELDRLGIPYSHLRYPTSTPIPKNGAKLAKDLRAIYQQVRKPLVVVGHSMGGAEALYAVLSDSNMMISGKVEKVILLEAAIGGSPFAEKMKTGMMASWLKYYLGEGLVSLTPYRAYLNFKHVYNFFYRSLIKRAVVLDPGHFIDKVKGDYQNISNRIYYVRSSIKKGERPSWGVRVVLSFCETNAMGNTNNDGLLSEEAQMLSLAPGFGVDLGVLEADHIELVVSGMSSRSNKNVREAFTRAMLRKAFETEFPLPEIVAVK